MGLFFTPVSALVGMAFAIALGNAQIAVAQRIAGGYLKLPIEGPSWSLAKACVLIVCVVLSIAAVVKNLESDAVEDGFVGRTGRIGLLALLTPFLYGIQARDHGW